MVFADILLEIADYEGGGERDAGGCKIIIVLRILLTAFAIISHDSDSNRAGDYCFGVCMAESRLISLKGILVPFLL